MKHGWNLFLLAGCVFLFGCQSTMGTLSQADFACPGQAINARMDGSRMRLTLNGQTHILERVRSASGARYASDESQGPGIEFWDKGGSATLTQGDREPVTCHRQWPPGLPLTARGQEPGWLLGLDEDDIVLDYQYGEQRFAAPTPAAEPTENGLRYRTSHQGKAFTLTLTRDYCEDSMSGMPYPYRARIQLDERTLSGCAGEPRQLLLGRDWTIKSINGEAMPGDNRPTLRFTAEGRVHGSGGCNRYQGRYRLTGEGLRIEGLAQTRMACGAAVMRREDEFLDTLSGTRRFRMGDNGSLRLIQEGERGLVAEP